MSEFNPISVERKILEIVNEISHGVSIAAKAYDAFTEADRKYDLAFARAYMNYEGPAHAKKYAAEINTADERTARDAAESAYRFVDKSNKALESKLDAMRSIGVSVRQAYANAGRGEF